MRGGALRGADGIALLGGLEDPGVVGLDEPVVMRELAAAHLEHPVALGVVPELLHAPDQPGTGVREQSRMEPAMRVAVGGDVLPAGSGGGFEVGDPDLGELLAAEQRDCQPHRETVEHHAHGVQVLEVVGRDRADPDAPSRLGPQQPLRLQQAHGLAQGRAADPELGRELDLRERRSRLELAEQDLPAELLVGVPGAGPTVQQVGVAVGPGADRGGPSRRRAGVVLLHTDEL